MITSLNLGRLGRFANQMFTIAGCIGIAEKSGNTFGFPQWINHDHKERFGSTEDINVYEHFVNPLPGIGGETNFSEIGYFWGYMELNYPTGNFSFNSHFQSEKYFKHCEKLIRHYFTMYDESDFPGTIAVHVRAGDYQIGEDVHHPRCTVEYYREALKDLKGEVLLFSDDLTYAGDLMNQVGRDYIPVDGDYLHNFRIMKRCSHFVCANSSYSMMAAILGPNPEKVITAPRLWFGKAWGENHLHLSSDIYPEGCKII